MSKEITPADRRRLAVKLDVNEATLYQALTGKGFGFKPEKCVQIERDSDNELRRWDLRPRDWHLIWPELIGKDGAPPTPSADSERATARGTLHLKRQRENHTPVGKPSNVKER